MIKNLLMAALTLVICSCGGGDSGSSRPKARPPITVSTGDTLSPMIWEIGPIIRGKNYSSHYIVPQKVAGGILIEFPRSPGHINYVTFYHGPLVGKNSITIRYRIEADDGVQIVPKCCPALPSIGPTLYFQRADDNWSRDGGRWWATFASIMPIVRGDYEVTVPLDGNWTSVNTMSRDKNREAFNDAIAGAGRIGFTFGGGDGYGHGVYATGPARMIITAFEVR